MNKTALISLPLLLISGHALAGWEVTEPNLGTIVMGIDMLDANTGFASGAANGAGPMIWKTTDGGTTWRVNSDETLTMSYLDISMADDEFGVTGGMGAFYLFSGSTRTTDGGRTWQKNGGAQFFAVYQDVEAIDTNSAVLVGSWGSLRTYADGIAVTRDRGRSWDSWDWGIDTYPRYASFPSIDVGYVSGGEWPSESARSMTPWQGRAISEHVRLPLTADTREDAISGTTYRGVIGRTTDQGESFELLLDIDGVYFNGIHFVDEMNGWVVGEGAESASIYHTADGGQTWQEQWTGAATLMQVRMANARVGWAVGGDLSSRRPDSLVLKTTDGGQTWSPEAVDGSFIFFNLDVVDANNAVAVGYNLSTGNCGVLRYVP